MPESYNVELAHDLAEHGARHAGRRDAWLGMAEAIVLAIVAVATAWSGYQASRWEGISTKHYALHERYTVLSQEKSTLAGQDRLYDIVTFNGWVAAKIAGHGSLAAFYERRFRPEYEVAFKAWLHLDPLHNKSAPAGPIFMPQYTNANASASVRYENVAVRLLQEGRRYARDRRRLRPRNRLSGNGALSDRAESAIRVRRTARHHRRHRYLSLGDQHVLDRHAAADVSLRYGVTLKIVPT